MNANELADELDEAVLKLVADDHFTEAQAVEECQTMLRQQQAEIEALKANVDAINTSKQYVDKSQNNRHEPVAWMRSDWSRVSLYEGDLCTIPLYTHPAKTLTDYEINSVWATQDFTRYMGFQDFARAILRKAQEK